MTKRKKQYFPKPNPRRDPAPGSDESYERPNLATINLEAGAGRAGLKVGDRVRIEGTGMFAGEIAVIERLSTGAIPSAVVRTESGRTRTARTIDLSPVKEEAPKPN